MYIDIEPEASTHAEIKLYTGVKVILVIFTAISVNYLT